MEGSNDALLNFPKLNKYNFYQWKSDIRTLLINRGLYEFVDGSETSLAEGASIKDVHHFERRQSETLSIIYSSLENNLKYLVKDAKTPKTAWKAVCEAFEPSLRARIAALRSKFVNTKFTPPETMSLFIERLLTISRELELAGKAIPDDEIAYQMLSHLPREYDNIVLHLFQFPEESFTSLTVQQALIAEYDNIQKQGISDENEIEKDDSSVENLTKTRKRQLSEQHKEKGNGHYRDLVGQKCRRTCDNQIKFEREVKNNKESFLLPETICNQIHSNLMIEPASTYDYVTTERFSLAFALYRLKNKKMISKGKNNFPNVK